VLWELREAYTPSISAFPKLSQRQDIQNRLRQIILESHVPRVDDLPIDEILRIRIKRKAELQRFRAGISTLATQVDLAASPEDRELQIQRSRQQERNTRRYESSRSTRVVAIRNVDKDGTVDRIRCSSNDVRRDHACCRCPIGRQRQCRAVWGPLGQYDEPEGRGCGRLS